MKKTVIVLFMLICIQPGYAQRKQAKPVMPPRYEKIINSNWTFNYFPDEKEDKGYESPAFDDSKWPAISIPHTWMTYETTGEIHPFIRSASENDNPYWWNGWGWYRKHFTVNPVVSGRKLFIEFEGVQKYCKVWINGKYLGDHKGGYGSFDFDITEFINTGKDNLLAVAVSNKRNDNYRIPPMAAGNFNLYGGIYRDVTLVIKDKLYIPMQGSASHEGGTFVTTSSVTENSGIVRVQTWVQNDHQEVKECMLDTYLIDAEGKIIQVLKSKAKIEPGRLFRFDQISKPVSRPKLWSPDNPYMYEVRSEVKTGGKITDILKSPLGFRWFRWDYNTNDLYVNDKKILIQGGNRHQEYPWLGDAIPKWITAMDFRDIKENLNYNFMRTAHYPNDRFVYDLTDRLGIIVNEESPSIKNQEFSPEVQEQQMKEMIRRDRNHPSIMMWSMGNETNHAVDSKYAIAEDTTRILTARRVSGGSEGKYVRHNDDNLPIENLLRCTVRGWYNTDVKDLEPSDPQHCGTEEHHQNMLKASGLFGTENLCTWLYEDHGADREYLNSPLLHVNPKGYVDVYRIPKYAYYFWQANYAVKPMIFIQPHYWRSQYIGQKRDIVVNSNCELIELKVNGTSKGTLKPSAGDFNSVTFKDITIEKGILSATGTKGGKQITAEIMVAGDPARIVLKSSHQKIDADRASVAIITADIVDSEGNHVYGATNTVKWSVTGPASLAGYNVYESDINKHHQMEGVWYIDMPVSNVIRSTGAPGKIHVQVSAPGLVSGSILIEAVSVAADNSIITEKVLNDEGRKRVTGPEAVVSAKVEPEGELRRTYSDISFGVKSAAEYKKEIGEIILRNNQSVDTTATEFRTLTNIFSEHLVRSGGLLIADDYNFNIGHFNNCRIITGYINPLKLPPLFKDWLRKYYAEEIIMKGNEKNSVDEMNWLNWIPSGGTVAVLQSDKMPVWPKGTIVTSKTGLDDLITAVHPVFAKYNAEAKERALVFIAKMNPYVKIYETSEIKDGKKVTNYTYIVERSKPVLIPFIKFISE